MHELDAEAGIMMADNVTADPAECDRGAYFRAGVGRERSAADGYIEHLAGDFRSIRQLEGYFLAVRRDAVVTAFIGKAKHISIDEPGQLLDDFLPFTGRCPNLDREPVGDPANDSALKTAEFVEVDDDLFADLDSERALQACTGRGDVDKPAVVLLAVLAHESTEKAEFDAAKTTAIRRYACDRGALGSGSGCKAHSLRPASRRRRAERRPWVG